MSAFKIAQDLAEMVPAPAGVAAAQTIFKSEDGILLCYGTIVPTDTTAGYAIGCLFMHVDGTVGTCLYCNEGTVGSCDFDAVTVG